jgi:hypothetical protein
LASPLSETASSVQATPSLTAIIVVITTIIVKVVATTPTASVHHGATVALIIIGPASIRSTSRHVVVAPVVGIAHWIPIIPPESIFTKVTVGPKVTLGSPKEGGGRSSLGNSKRRDRKSRGERRDEEKQKGGELHDERLQDTL